MNNGGLENRKEHETLQRQSKSSKFRTQTDYSSLAIAKVAVAQVCECVGFQSFQHSALETSSDIIVRYTYSIGKTANFNANLVGRIEANVFDVVQGLQELGLGLGLAGSSDVDRCVVNSGIVRDIVHFVGDAYDIPLAYDVPRFQVVKEWKETQSFWEKGKEPAGEHIPSWLPAFLDPETYATRSITGNEMMSVLNGEKTQLARVERKVEEWSSNLQHCFACNENEGGSSRDVGDAGRAREASDSNPYLADSLHFGEKEVEVSPVVLPAKLSNEVALRNPVICVVENHVSMLERFAPAIETMKSGLFDSKSPL